MRSRIRAGFVRPRRSAASARQALMIAGVLLSCASAHAQGRIAGSGEDVRAVIEAANKKFIEGAAKGDAAMIASVYTPDAEAFPPNADIVKGRPAIQKMWQSVLDSGVSAFTLASTEVESAGNLAYEVGTYEMKGKDGTVVDRGKYCVVWKRVGGQWLLHRDIWSTSMPETKK
jgi:ketosteroid isomerase-like protein